MTHPIATKSQWLQARLELLKEEKELTRRTDEVARHRMALPWVRVNKPYQFDTDTGPASLAGLFQGRSQLLLYHFMFGPDYTAGCPACSAIADGFNPIVIHLANHDVTLGAVSRAPLEKLQAYKKRMGWTFPWASSAHTDFNTDFQVAFTEEQQRIGNDQYNYQRATFVQDPANPPKGVSTFAAMCGTDAATYTLDRPGMSSFIIQAGIVYHTYSAYARGLDAIWSMYPWLDRAPKGRNESGLWFKRHDEYEGHTQSTAPCCEK